MTDKYRKVAALIIKITNPVYLGLLVIVVAVCLDSKDFSLLTRALSVLFIFMIVLPLGYTWLRMHAAGLRGDPTKYLKHHPIDILALEIVCGLPCWFILSYLKAPDASKNILIVLIVTAFITAVINIFYRSSFHLAAFTVLLFVVVRNWGDSVPLFACGNPGYCLGKILSARTLSGTTIARHNHRRNYRVCRNSALI